MHVHRQLGVHSPRNVVENFAGTKRKVANSRLPVFIYLFIAIIIYCQAQLVHVRFPF